MAMRQSFQQKLLQKLSPQQIQLMKLLQVPTANLDERIKEEMEENPALELDESKHEDQDEIKDEFSENGEEEFDEPDGSPDEYDNIDISDYVKDGDDDIADYRLRDDNYSGEDDKKTIPYKKETSFYEMLFGQLGLLKLHDKEKKVAEQIVGSIDEDDIAESGFGIQREHHAGRSNVRTHHLLHADGERHLRVIKPLMHAIGNRPVIEERGENATAGDQQVFRAADIEKGVLLAGEGGIRKVLGRGRAARRHVRLRSVLSRQVPVRRRDFPGQVRRHVGIENPAANLGAGPLQLRQIIRIHAFQARLDALGEMIVFEKMPVGPGSGGESVGDPHAFGAQVAEHLAQGSVLATDEGDVIHPQLGKCADITHAEGTK